MNYQEKIKEFASIAAKSFNPVATHFTDASYAKDVLDYCQVLKEVETGWFERVEDYLQENLSRARRINIDRDFDYNIGLEKIDAKYNAERKKEHEFFHNYESHNNTYFDGVRVLEDDQLYFPFLDVDLNDEKLISKANKLNNIKREYKRQRYLQEHEDVKKYVLVNKAKKYLEDKQLLQKLLQYNDERVEWTITLLLQAVDAEIEKSQEYYRIKSGLMFGNLLTNILNDPNKTKPAYENLLRVANAAGLCPDQKSVIVAASTATAAKQLHEGWRETIYNKETKTYEPRWKPIDSHIEVSEKATVRTDHMGNKEIDIANTAFEDLTLGWQMENYLAAEVAVKLAAKNGKYSVSEAGAIIHDKWLMRNKWAKYSELGVPFAELSIEEQKKDTDQFITAQNVLNKTESLINTYVSLNTDKGRSM